MRAPKICFLAPMTSIHTIRWVNSLAERGVDVHLATMHGATDSLHPSVNLQVLPHKAPLGYFTNVPFLKRFLGQHRFDLLHAHFASGYGTLARLTKFHPYLLSVWGSDVYEFPSKNLLFKKLIQANLKAQDFVASTSHAMGKQVLTLQSTLKQPFITPFGIDTTHFSPQKVEKKKLRIGTVKTLHPRYGIDSLIHAYHFARQNGLSDTELCIVGEGPQLSAMQALAKNLGLEKEVIFPGKVPHADVPKWLSSFDVYLALSNAESFGVAILEASACEIPVIVSDVGGLPEVVLPGETGFIVSKGDHVAAGKKILELLRNPELARQMGQAGRRFVTEKYQWSQSVDEMLRIYEKILKP